MPSNARRLRRLRCHCRVRFKVRRPAREFAVHTIRYKGFFCSLGSERLRAVGRRRPVSRLVERNREVEEQLGVVVPRLRRRAGRRRRRPPSASCGRPPRRPGTAPPSTRGARPPPRAPAAGPPSGPCWRPPPRAARRARSRASRSAVDRGRGVGRASPLGSSPAPASGPVRTGGRPPAFWGARVSRPPVARPAGRPAAPVLSAGGADAVGALACWVTCWIKAAIRDRPSAPG